MGIDKKIYSAFRSEVWPVKGYGILADGSKITFAGVADVSFKIEECEYQHQFILADVSHYVLSELDFFSLNRLHAVSTLVQPSSYIRE